MFSRLKRAVLLPVALLLAALMVPALVPGPGGAVGAGSLAVGSWTVISQGGFGSGTDRPGAGPFAEYDGDLYCGAAVVVETGPEESESRLEVRKLVGTAWIPVGDLGFGEDENSGVASLKAYDGHLYAGTSNEYGCEVWRYDGSDWQKLVGRGAATNAGFGNRNNVAAACMEVHDGKLYVGTVNIKYSTLPTVKIESDGGEVWAFDGTAWAKDAPSGFGDTKNLGVVTLREYDGALYAGTARVDISTEQEGVVVDVTVEGAGCELRKRNAANDWARMGERGFGDPGNAALTAMEEHQGKLVLGTTNGGGYVSVYFNLATFETRVLDFSWHSDGCGVYSWDGSTVTGLVTGGFGDTDNASASATAVVSVSGTEVLLLSVSGVSGLETQDYSALAPLYAYNGAAWYRAAENGFGKEENLAVSALHTRSGQVYAGTLNPEEGCEIWRGTPPAGPAPFIDAVEPPAAKEGSPVVIRGEHFGGSQGGSTVVFGGGKQAQVTAWSDTSITCVVPQGAESGTVVVNTALGQSNGFLFAVEGYTWYLAEGSTDGGMETWVLVQNPGEERVVVDVELMTDEGSLKPPALQNVAVPAASRKSFPIHLYKTTYNVSTKVTVKEGGPVVCERAMYGGNRTWAHDSIGVSVPARQWYLAEGCTGGDFETFVLVQNPGNEDAKVSLTFMTSTGKKDGPKDFLVRKGSRHTFKANDYVDDWDVSTMVRSDRPVVCERAVYGNGRAWAHDSAGVTAPAVTWYLAEGCTGGDFETWVLVQNPGQKGVKVDLTFMTFSGEKKGPQGFPIAGGSRHSFRVNDYVYDWDVSTMVTAEGGQVICERAVYGGNRTWGHDSVGVTAPGTTWYLAEGCTGGDFETWVLVQNPGNEEAKVTLTFMTSTGKKDGPKDFLIPKGSRHSFRVNDYVNDYDVSTMVKSNKPVICERAMYGGNRSWAHDSVGLDP